MRAVPLGRAAQGSVLSLAELRHERSHGAKLQLFEGHTRGGVRQERLRLLDEAHVFLADRELHLVPKGLEPSAQVGLRASKRRRISVRWRRCLFRPWSNALWRV
jgi:hypothetical protein